MVKSMTGYGVSKIEHPMYDVSVEVKSLNSKFLDAGLRGLPKEFNDKEITVRNLLSNKLIRGKVTVSIEVTPKTNNENLSRINKEVFKNYYHDLSSLAEELSDTHNNIFELSMGMPKVIESPSAEIDQEELWTNLSKGIHEAIIKCTQHRQDEGAVLHEKLVSYIDTIENQLNAVISQDPGRIEKIRERINGHLTEYLSKENIDASRFEQEMIFYIEKLDITEEKVRLKNHLDYFRSIIASDEANGKKLGFIAQEIGREINTVGSKSNDAEMQKSVVQMKDELEKIKEQVLNVL